MHEPHEPLAFVHLRTSSSVNRPCSRIALTIVLFLTPLQPQTSAESAIAEARLLPPWPVSPRCAWPNIRWSRIEAMSLPSLTMSKYHEPSAVSP